MKTIPEYKQISFKATKAEFSAMARVANRAHALNREYDYQTALMDINTCHSNGNPIDFEKLESFDDFNFAHDVFGIARHIDRTTGQLDGFFVPRSSRK